MKEILRMGRKMGLGNIIIKVESFIMEIGLITKNRDMEPIFIIVAKDMKDSLKITWSMEKGKYMKKMVIGIKGNSMKTKSITWGNSMMLPRIKSLILYSIKVNKCNVPSKFHKIYWSSKNKKHPYRIWIKTKIS